jgi:hypothetical protein
MSETYTVTNKHITELNSLIRNYYNSFIRDENKEIFGEMANIGNDVNRGATIPSNTEGTSYSIALFQNFIHSVINNNISNDVATGYSTGTKNGLLKIKGETGTFVATDLPNLKFVFVCINIINVFVDILEAYKYFIDNDAGFKDKLKVINTIVLVPSTHRTKEHIDYISTSVAAQPNIGYYISSEPSKLFLAINSLTSSSQNAIFTLDKTNDELLDGKILATDGLYEGTNLNVKQYVNQFAYISDSNFKINILQYNKKTNYETFNLADLQKNCLNNFLLFLAKMKVDNARNQVNALYFYYKYLHLYTTLVFSTMNVVLNDSTQNTQYFMKIIQYTPYSSLIGTVSSTLSAVSRVSSAVTTVASTESSALITANTAANAAANTAANTIASTATTVVQNVENIASTIKNIYEKLVNAQNNAIDANAADVLVQNTSIPAGSTEEQTTSITGSAKNKADTVRDYANAANNAANDAISLAISLPISATVNKSITILEHVPSESDDLATLKTKSNQYLSVANQAVEVAVEALTKAFTKITRGTTITASQVTNALGTTITEAISAITNAIGTVSETSESITNKIYKSDDAIYKSITQNTLTTMTYTINSLGSNAGKDAAITIYDNAILYVSSELSRLINKLLLQTNQIPVVFDKYRTLINADLNLKISFSRESVLKIKYDDASISAANKNYLQNISRNLNEKLEFIEAFSVNYESKYYSITDIDAKYIYIEAIFPNKSSKIVNEFRPNLWDDTTHNDETSEYNTTIKIIINGLLQFKDSYTSGMNNLIHINNNIKQNISKINSQKSMFQYEQNRDTHLRNQTYWYSIIIGLIAFAILLLQIIKVEQNTREMAGMVFGGIIVVFFIVYYVINAAYIEEFKMKENFYIIAKSSDLTSASNTDKKDFLQYQIDGINTRFIEYFQKLLTNIPLVESLDFYKHLNSIIRSEKNDKTNIKDILEYKKSSGYSSIDVLRYENNNKQIFISTLLVSALIYIALYNVSLYTSSEYNNLIIFAGFIFAVIIFAYYLIFASKTARNRSNNKYWGPEFNKNM